MTVLEFAPQRAEAQSPAAVAWQAPELAVIVPSFNERDNVSLLFEKVSEALAATPFEFIVVDDNSPDGTAEVVKGLARKYPNVRCIHRIGRRGLSSAVTEGMASTAAPYVAVIDADLQHDEAILPEMLRLAKEGNDVVVGTRYTGEGSASAGFSSTRERGSRLATRLSTLITGVNLSDPMSGFFLMRREIFDEVAPRLSSDGFKILLDIVVTATRFRAKGEKPLRIAEVPYSFRARHAGESKMNPLVVVQFLGLLLSKLSGGYLPTSFLLFGLVGGTGLVVHMVTLTICNALFHPAFWISQTVAAVVSMTTNYILNNELTYADKKLKGARFWVGLLSFYAVCSFGLIANVSVANLVFTWDHQLYIAAIVGVIMSVVFNYAVTRVFTWR